MIRIAIKTVLLRSSSRFVYLTSSSILNLSSPREYDRGISQAWQFMPTRSHVSTQCHGWWSLASYCSCSYLVLLFNPVIVDKVTKGKNKKTHKYDEGSLGILFPQRWGLRHIRVFSFFFFLRCLFSHFLLILLPLYTCSLLFLIIFMYFHMWLVCVVDSVYVCPLWTKLLLSSRISDIIIN